ncbi:DUF3524 domain-containing protein [Marinomonas sp. C2222]|uniref:tRNA-queuosine alpha-mannosyltransferase n=1 Tax=Marinomonas sargassi TaxID=2984494 RepID=A0ABT2YSU2_9GAMM|nr:DUF3524 domain-containing protein [Marinomonas sargassi]MCV2402951.1 DUF3524 domain-containing protein [Marinomonas sargassi]
MISAYEAKSHKAWATCLMEGLPEHSWEYIYLPARHFAWRIRGNAMSFAFDPKFKASLEKPYDLVIATSMTDCIGLKAFCPDLQNIPWLLYFHENQFAYPASDKQQGVVEMQMMTLYSALAVDQCIFNSQFNRNSFFNGARALLNKLPDYVSPDWLTRTQEKSIVLPVPLDISLQHPSSPTVFESDNPIKLVWSARWEFDKGPDRLQAILQELENRGVNYQIAILGEQFRSIPDEFEQIKVKFLHRITQFGYVEKRSDYLKILSSSDMVLSTALHEFQGLSVLEAVSLGCIPILPNRQVYTEIFDEFHLYQSDLDDVCKEAKGAADLIIQRTEVPVLPLLESYLGNELIKKYHKLIEKLKVRVFK